MKQKRDYFVARLLWGLFPAAILLAVATGCVIDHGSMNSDEDQTVAKAVQAQKKLGKDWKIPEDKSRFHIFLLMGQSNMAGGLKPRHKGYLLEGGIWGDLGGIWGQGGDLGGIWGQPLKYKIRPGIADFGFGIWDLFSA